MPTPDTFGQELVKLDNKPSTVSANPGLYVPSSRVSAYNTFMRNEGIASSITYFPPNEYVAVDYLAARAFAAGAAPTPGQLDFSKAAHSGLIPLMYGI